VLFDQAVFAGQFLAGSFGSLATHRANATLAGVAVMLSTIAAVLVRWPGGGPLWPAGACLGLFALIGVQIGLGFNRVLSVHVPLGVAIILLTALLAGWAWRRHPTAVPTDPPPAGQPGRPFALAAATDQDGSGR
jgi:uncharacterized membrane protein YfcA